ncbi:MAG: ABC transporter permease [Alkalicoccus sp.]|uniref:ABC transporter permease n=1 Tax=Alkalicoccus sp. TaxID=2005376 RepID=A0A651DJG2_9BACI|nr:MAG: ABC transporter permease [Alkalicoccus sp.]
MKNFIWKDFVVIVRNRSDIIVLLLMPLVLIGILGFALGGLMAGDTSGIDVQVALVEEDDADAGLARFTEELEAMELPPEAAAELEETAENIQPSRLLQDVLTNSEIEEILTVNYLASDEAESLLAEGELDAVVTLPENFTYDGLQAMIWNEGGPADIHVMLREDGSLYADIFTDVLEGFVENVNLESAIAAAAGLEVQETAGPVEEIGGAVTMSQNEPVQSMQYYAVGMAVMFVLYTAGTIAEKAFVEKREQVYNRIILSGAHPVKYLSGKWLSGTTIALLQLVILFLLSTLLFRTFPFASIDFWLGMMLITVVLAVCVGSLTSLVTSLSIRFENEAIATIFSGGMVTLAAFAGGSFFPLAAMPDVITAVGNWTPNGAAMTGYLLWIQGFELTALRPFLERLILLSVVMLAVSVLIFPRRGASS